MLPYIAYMDPMGYIPICMPNYMPIYPFIPVSSSREYQTLMVGQAFRGLPPVDVRQPKPRTSFGNPTAGDSITIFVCSNLSFLMFFAGCIIYGFV